MYNLLLVEDAKDTTEYLKSLIKNNSTNINVINTTNFDDACTLIQNEEFTIDFFFFDIVLDEDNEKNGISLGRFVRSFDKYKNSPIIFLTGFDNYAIEAINHVHCSYYITKPFIPEQVCKIIHTLGGSLDAKGA